MIPILYESTETTFTSNGLGRLSDAISCKVDEKKNGSYELEMKYPVKGIHFDDLIEDRLIFAKPFDGGNNQAFRIYSIEKSLDGNAVVYGEHISYLLNQTTVLPFTASSCAEAIARLPQYFATQSYFTFDTDKEVTGTFELTEPKQVRGVLGGESGSLLDVYGKIEYEFDNFTVHAWLNRGSDNGVTLRYGKNITELTDTGDDQSTYTGIVPFWRGTEEDGETEVVKIISTTPVIWSSHQADFAYPRVIPVDFSQEWQEEPTDQQLIDKANTYINNNSGWKKKQTIDISFVALWQTEEYKNVAALERVKLCDDVTVIYPELGVSDKLQVIETDYDVLLERYNSIKLGSTRTSLVNDVVSIDSKIANVASAVESAKSSLNKAIEHATDLITGGLGGHVVIGTDADGKPNEIYIMDTADVETATQVLRMNLNGIGFSSNGINGPYGTAWTLDGHFVADYITSGTLDAGLVKVGVLAGRNNQDNWWDLYSGEFHIGTQTAQQIAQYVDAAGLILYMPYTITGTTVHFTARVMKGEEDVTYNYPAGSFNWFKKDNFIITEIGSGYTMNFDLRDFEYGGSIILRLEKMDFFYILDDNGDRLLDHDGNPLMSMDISTSYDYVYLLDKDGNILTDADGNALAGYTEVPWISVETDFTNGAKTSELALTTDELVSRFDHYDGGNQTIESVINQKASSITMSVSGTGDTGASIEISLLDDEGNVLDSADGDITLSGNVVFKSNLTDGVTRISGDNITTGTIQSSTGNLKIDLDDDTMNVTGAIISSGQISGASISGGSISQVVSGASQGSISGNNPNNQQASISNGIVTCGQISLRGQYSTQRILLEGADDAGGYYGVWFDGHVSTGGCIWAGREAVDEYRVSSRGYVWARKYVALGGWEQASDRRYKHDIEDIDESKAVDFILGLRPVHFIYNYDTKNQIHHGFIAQEVEEIAEDWDVVTETYEPDDPSEKLKTLAYTEIIADLVKTVQSLNKRVEELEKLLEKE